MKSMLGRYWSLLRRYLLVQRGRMVFMAVLLLAGLGLQLLGPQISRRFIDAAKDTSLETDGLTWLALLYIVVALLSSALKAWAAYVSNDVAWVATNGLRQDLSAHALRLGMGYHKSRPPGEMIERIDGDVNALSGFFSSFVVNLGGNVLLLLGVLATLFVQDWRLGVVFTVYSVLGTVFLFFASRFSAVWRKDREQAATFYGFVGEVMAASEDLRGNGAVPWALGRTMREIRAWFAVKLNAHLKGSLVWGAGIALFACADMLSYGLGSSLFAAGTLTLGGVYMLVHYAWMIAEPIENFRQQLEQLQRSEASIDRVGELFAQRSEVQDGDLELPQSRTGLGVELRRVTFSYEDDAPVLHEVNLTLEAGSVLGLLGRSGSGKTTLARLLFRFYDPQHGEVRIANQDVRRYTLASMRRQIALVTQDVQLFNSSLRDNLSFFDESINDTQLQEALGTLGLGGWLASLPKGLETELGPGVLSAGEAQLVALARTFLRDPKLVILDEASARLDPATEEQLEQALTGLLKNRSAVIVAHRLHTVERATHIAIMEAGRVIEYGERLALQHNPNSRLAQLRRLGLEEVLA